MKIFQPILLFLWIVVTIMTGVSTQTLSSHQLNCVFNSYFDDIEQIDMGHHRIYTLFTPHLSGQSRDVMSVVRVREDIESKIRRFDAILTQNRDTVQNEQRDIQQIAHLIRSEQLSWIGLESSPEEMRSFVEYRVEAYRQLKFGQSLFANLDAVSTNWDTHKTDQILTLLFPAVTIACGNDQEACHEVEQIPLENENLKIEQINSHQEEQRLLQGVFLDFLNSGLMTRHQFEGMTNIAIANMLNDQKPISDEDVEDFFDNFKVTPDFDGLNL